MTKLTIHKSDLIAFTAIVVVGILSRTILHVAPNFELITGLTLLSATRLKQPLSWLAPLVMLLVSDFIIGNTAIFIFTWSGFAFTYLLGRLSRSKVTQLTTAKRYLSYEVMAVVSVLAFFLWTNGGVVVTSQLYAHTFSGYLESLIMALPFLKTQLLSVVLTMPLIIGVYELASGKLKLDRKIELSLLHNV